MGRQNHQWPFRSQAEMPNAIHHIALVVRDPARSAEIFGLLFAATISPAGQGQRGPPEMLVRLPGVALTLVHGERASTRTDDHIAFAVSEADLPELADKLASIGLASQVSRAGLAAKSIYFFDYDNHLFELHAGPPIFA